MAEYLHLYIVLRINIMQDSLIYIFDLFGTCIFAITGAVKGVRQRLDFLGVIVYAITVGCAGGMIRDCLIGSTPVSSFSDGNYLIVCIITGVIVFFIAPKVVGRWRIILFCDAIGLGVFTAIGAAKAMMLGIGPVGQILAGVIGAVGGGVLRDVFSREIPSVLVSDFYATASILGAVLFVALESFTPLSYGTRFVLSASLTIVLRILAIQYGFKLPVARMAGEEKRSKN